MNEGDEEMAEIAAQDFLYGAEEELAKAGDGDLTKKVREKVNKAIEEARNLPQDMTKKPAEPSRAERPKKEGKTTPKPKAAT